MPEISRNAPILLTGLPSCLSATNTTSSSCLPKKPFTPALYLQSPTTPNVFGKQSTNSSTANPPHHYSPLLALHFQTALLFFHSQNIQTLSLSPPTLLHHLALTFSSCYSPWFVSFHSFGTRHPQDPFELSKHAIWFRSYPHLPYQRMFIRIHPCSHQHCQPISYFRPFSSHSQAICHLSTTEDTHFG